MAMEVITTTDKDARDRMFEDLRRNGNELEKQVVKFSGVEDVPESDRTVRYRVSGSKEEGHLLIFKSGKAIILGPRPQVRHGYRSTWSVAYPNKPDSNPTPRRARRDRPHEWKENLSGNLKEEVVA